LNLAESGKKDESVVVFIFVAVCPPVEPARPSDERQAHAEKIA
jgi:hypothetical protein